MNTDIIRKIHQVKPKVVILDIDGTLKDLCTEHEIALRSIVQKFKVGTHRKEVIMFLNKIAMSMVKTGVFSTNEIKQRLLVWIFAVISGKDIKRFLSEYYNCYSKQLELFDGVKEFLTELNNNYNVYFSTINKQNYNLEESGISKDKIVCSIGSIKVNTYKKLIENIDVAKDKVLIVGDNVFDDWLAAKLLGVECLLVNNYNSKLKKVILKLLNGKYL